MPLEKKYQDLIGSIIPSANDDAVKTRLSNLFDRVVETNEKINITSLVSPIDVTLKHIVDSLSLYLYPDFQKAVGEKKNVCDIGCGGGFPGLPVACLSPETCITMIDSTEKKILALKDNAKELDLPFVFPVWGRGEELAGVKGKHREKYDLCVSRAVAGLHVLCELCLPFVKKGGVFVAMKGARAKEELEESLRAIPMLGGSLKEVFEIQLKTDMDLQEFSEEERSKIEEFLSSSRFLIVIEKKKQTQPQFPRKWSQMTKKPL